ncbi:MAG: cysteine hydrolase family protein [Candidatus Bathyarchaeia archaeon]
MKPALLVIDVISDFVTGKFGGERAQSIVPNIGRLLGYAREVDAPIIYVTDSHRLGDREFQIWGNTLLAALRGLR